MDTLPDGSTVSSKTSIDEELTSTRLQVVQASYGDCFILQFVGDDHQPKNWLIDGGPGNQSFAGSFKTVNHCLFGALNHLKVESLDRLIITHDDKDHIFGISSLLASFGADHIKKENAAREKIKVFIINLYDVCKMTRWSLGHTAIRDKKFPINNIWYNDRLFVANYNGKKLGKGWLSIMLELFGTVDGCRALNSEWPDVSNKTDARIISTEQYQIANRKFDNIVRIAGPSNKDMVDLHDKLKTSLRIKSVSIADAEKAVQKPSASYPTSLDSWDKMDTPNLSGKDTSATNLSSIMFEFKDATGFRILMTGDGTGDRLKAAYPNEDTYDIIKLMHHGSSNNNVINKQGVTQDTVQRGKNFFRHFRARKYVVSSDTLNTCPNPDFDFLRAFAEEVEENALLHKARLYLTNGLTAAGWIVLNEKWDDDEMALVPRSHVARVYVLKNSAITDYGSIVPSRTDDPTDKETKAEDSWVQMAEDNHWMSRMAIGLPAYYSLKQLGLDAKSLLWALSRNTLQQHFGRKSRDTSETTKEKAAKKVESKKSKTSRKAAWKRLLKLDPDAELEIDTDPDAHPYWKTSRRPDFMPGAKKHCKVEHNGNSVKSATAGTNATQRYMVSFASGGMAPGSAGSASPTVEWHDIMIMNFLEEKRLAVLTLRPGPIPVPQQLPISSSQGAAVPEGLFWVDLPQYLTLLENECKSRRKLYPTFDEGEENTLTHLANLRTLFAADMPTSSILAATFLSALFDEDIAAEFFVSLPINVDGTESAALHPLLDDIPCSVFNMLVSDIRLQVFLPSEEDYSKGKRLDVVEMMFDLGPPPSELWDESPDAFMVWNVPFRSGNWSPTECLVQHKEKLRFRMLWPFYRNAVTLCFFSGNLVVTHTGRKELGLEGVMCCKRGSVATYDLQIRSSDAEALRIIDVFEMLSPTAAVASFLIQGLAAEIDLPGVNLSDIINKTLVLHGVGIVLRQHAAGLRAVTIDDVYGTIKLDSIIKLAQGAMGIPPFLQLKAKLPDLTLQVTNVTGSEGHKYSCAFTYEIEAGTVAVQFTAAKQGSLQFDLWVICKDLWTVANWLAFLGQTGLAPEFDSTSLFSEALSHVSVKFVHVSIYKPVEGSWSLLSLDFTVVLEDVSIPSKDPVLKLEQLTMDLSYNMPTKNLSLYISAVLNLGGYDADCTVLYDKSKKAIDDFLTNQSDLESIEPEGGSPAATTILDMKVSFPTKGPSIGSIIQGLLGGIIDDPMGPNSLTNNIPEDFLIILTSNDFQNVEIRLEKSGEKNAEWKVAYMFISVRLDGLKQALQKVLPSLTFDVPRLTVMLNHLDNKEKRSYNVSLGSVFSIKGSLCQLTADFSSPPPGKALTPEKYFSLQLRSKLGSPGLPIGKVLQEFVDDKFDSKGLAPEELHKAIDSVTIESALVSFVKTAKRGTTNTSWGMHVMNISVLLLNEPWEPFTNFKVSDVKLYVSHDFARAQSTEIDPESYALIKRMPKTAVQFSGRLHIKKTEFLVTFTYESNPTAYSFNLIPSEELDVLQLIFDSIELAIDIPNEIKEAISSIFVIKTSNFFISYSKADGDHPETIVFSNQGEISLFGIGVSNISVYCEKPAGSNTWSSYTVALALPTPCAPLAGFLPGINALDGIKILNGKFSYFKNSPSSKVFTESQLSVAKSGTSAAKKNDIMLSGTLDFKSSTFLRTVSKIVSIDSIDVCVQTSGLTVAIPAPSKGVKFFDILELKTFSLSVAVAGFSLGVAAQLTAPWFTKQPVESTLKVELRTSGAVGAEVTFSAIREPFGMPGIYLDNSIFGMVFLLEAASPQSGKLKAGVLLTQLPGGAEQIRASVDMSIDVLKPMESYLKMDIENLTLANLIKAMTDSDLPPILKADYLRLGFKKLKIDIVPAEKRFYFDAEFFFFALAGKIKAEVNMKTGIQFAANLDVVNILGMLKIHSYNSDKVGPFVYLDSRAIGGKDVGMPAWLGVTSKDDPNLAGCIFALSACVSFLGIEMKVYGVINTRGLELILASKADIVVPGIDMHLSSQFTLSINKSRLLTTAAFNLSIGLDFQDINLFGLSLGSFKGSLFELKSSLSLSVNYGGNDWLSNGVDFSVEIDVTILGLNIKGTCSFGITLRSISDLVSAIKSWVQRQIVDKLKAVLQPVIDFAKDVGKAIGQAAHEIGDALGDGVTTLKEVFNTSAFEVTNMLTEAGHTAENIATELKNILGLGLGECASVLSDFGHEISSVINILDSVFSAPKMDMVNSLYSAGFDGQNVVESTFGPMAMGGANILGVLGAMGALAGGSSLGNMDMGAFGLLGGALGQHGGPNMIGGLLGAIGAINAMGNLLDQHGPSIVGGLLNQFGPGAATLISTGGAVGQLMGNIAPVVIGSAMSGIMDFSAGILGAGVQQVGGINPEIKRMMEEERQRDQQRQEDERRYQNIMAHSKERAGEFSIPAPFGLDIPGFHTIWTGNEEQVFHPPYAETNVEDERARRSRLQEIANNASLMRRGSSETVPEDGSHISGAMDRYQSVIEDEKQWRNEMEARTEVNPLQELGGELQRMGVMEYGLELYIKRMMRGREPRFRGAVETYMWRKRNEGSDFLRPSDTYGKLDTDILEFHRKREAIRSRERINQLQAELVFIERADRNVINNIKEGIEERRRR